MTTQIVIDKDLFDYYQIQVRNNLYNIELAKTLKEAKGYAKKADLYAVLLRNMSSQIESA